MKVTIYHNPRCSKSRQTLDLIRKRNIDADVIEYLKTPPDRATLERILALLELEPRELMRKNESVYKQEKLDDKALSREALISAMLDYPILIERPIVLSKSKARIGRPPEKVLEIL